MPAKPPIVLIVADQLESLAMYAFGLLAMGFNPVTAANAEEAFARACQVHPDAIVAEIAVPDVFAVALIRRLRDDVRTRSAGILVIGDTDAAQKSEAYSACDRFVLKPCLPDQLCMQISEVLSAQRRA